MWNDYKIESNDRMKTISKSSLILDAGSYKFSHFALGAMTVFAAMTLGYI